MKIREWTIHEELGRGGMGVVYRATHDMVQGDFAIKVIKPDLAKDSEAQQRFLHEVNVVVHLSHQNIVKAEMPFVFEESVYLPMEMLEGEMLDKRLEARPGPWPPTESIDIVRQAALGLGHGHQQDPPFLHRDVKPSNLHISTQGRVKVLDFGLAKAVGDRSLTSPGLAVGTPAFIAPEVLKGEPSSPASDVYALGVVLFRLLTGRLPIELPEDQSSVAAVLWSVVQAHQQGLPRVDQFEKSVSAELVDLTARCLDSELTARPSDGRALAAMLQGLGNRAPQVPLAASASSSHLVPGTHVALPTMSGGPAASASGPDSAVDAAWPPTGGAPVSGSGTAVALPQMSSADARQTPEAKPTQATPKKPSVPRPPGTLSPLQIAARILLGTLLFGSAIILSSWRCTHCDGDVWLIRSMVGAGTLFIGQLMLWAALCLRRVEVTRWFARGRYHAFFGAAVAGAYLSLVFSPGMTKPSEQVALFLYCLGLTMLVMGLLALVHAAISIQSVHETRVEPQDVWRISAFFGIIVLAATTASLVAAIRGLFRASPPLADAMMMSAVIVVVIKAMLDWKADLLRFDDSNQIWRLSRVLPIPMILLAAISLPEAQSPSRVDEIMMLILWGFGGLLLLGVVGLVGAAVGRRS